ncbi:LysR family transcriptional regulator [Marinicellulosiphila megalodicopiae]|uniref:LysR family transcriptional regulator n=1 Tax=Marinicellulosiphila megalodicopiae TaxID=2724896 RepID=UPI003BAF65DC
MNSDINWQWLQLFLVVAKQGSFSKTANVLNLSQPTVSRQIQQLEKQVGKLLFHRTPSGLTLTNDAQHLFEKALIMQDAHDAVLRSLNGQDETLMGSIRISVNEVMGFYALPPIIAAFSKLYPSIEVELVVTNQSSSLNKREADIALRMYQPVQPDLIAQKITDLALCAYASQDYIDVNGTPNDIADLVRHHKLIGFDKDLQMINGFKDVGVHVTQSDFNFRCDHLLLQVQLLKQGCGVGVTHKTLGEKYGLVALFDGMEIGQLPLWVVCHQEVKFNKKIRVFKDFLTQSLKRDPYSFNFNHDIEAI